MANITNVIADNSGFVPQTWALEALNVLRNQITLARTITKDSDMAEGGWQGKTLNIPYPGTFTAQDKVAGNVATVQTPQGGTTVSLTLSKHKTIDFLVEDYAQAQANSDLLQRYVQPAVIALAEQFETDLWTMASGLTGTSVGTAGTDLTSGVVRSIKKILDTAKAPMQDRYLVVSPKDAVALLGDSTLSQYYAFQNADAITAGQLPNLYGMKVFESQFVPVVTGTPNTTQNMAFHKSAMMFAMRPFAPIPTGSGVATATVTDDESGLAIRVLKQYSPQYRAEYIGFDILYGFTTLRPSQGLIVNA